MIPTPTILACIFTLLVSLVLPVVFLFFYAGKNRKQGIPSAWLLGAAGFFLTQIVIRTPVLSFLSTQPWFLSFSQNHLFAYAFCLAFTAGLFELAGRYAVAVLMRRNLTWQRSLAAGLGHGGIEAMFLVGMTYVNNLAYILMIQSGTFDAMLTQLPSEQAAALESIRASFLTTSPVLFAMAGIERILAMIAHTAMSVVVCRGVATGNTGKAVLLCLGLHTLIDLTAGISLLIGTRLTLVSAYSILYGILILAAILSISVLWNIRRRWHSVSV